MARKGGKDRGLFQRQKVVCAACKGVGCAKCEGSGKVGTGPWWICWVDPRGKTRIRKIGPDKRAALLAYQRVKSDPESALPPEQRRPTTISELIDTYVRTSAATKRSAKDDARYGRVWREWLGGRAIEDVKPADIEAWRTLRAARTPTPRPATLNRHVAFLKRVYYVAIRDELTERNPAARVKLLREENLMLRYLDEAEEDQLLPRLPAILRGMVVVALHTGLRQTEQFSLRRSYVDLRLAMLRLPRTKAGPPRAVKLNQDALEALRDQLASHDSDWVYPGPTAPHGRRTKIRVGHVTFSTIRPAWEKALKEAGIRDFRWHDLRHSFASRLVMAGVDLPTVQALLGHRSLAMVQRYAHLAPKHLEDAVARLCRRTVTRTATDPAGDSSGNDGNTDSI